MASCASTPRNGICETGLLILAALPPALAIAFRPSGILWRPMMETDSAWVYPGGICLYYVCREACIVEVANDKLLRIGPGCGNSPLPSSTSPQKSGRPSETVLSYGTWGAYWVD